MELERGGSVYSPHKFTSANLNSDKNIEGNFAVGEGLNPPLHESMFDIEVLNPRWRYAIQNPNMISYVCAS
jgi:hypothetical protein